VVILGRVCADLTGKKFNRLTVIERNGYNKWDNVTWLCKCDCGNYYTTAGYFITSGKVKSCGCLSKETNKRTGLAKIILCTYDLTGEYGIGYTNKGEEFYFDLEDYDKIKDKGWYKSKNREYIRTRQKSEEFGDMLHHIVTETPPHIILDHVNRNPRDNRKENIRVATHSQNGVNRNLTSRNTSGIIGVCNKRYKKWYAYIQIDKKLTCVGSFDDFEEAVIARLKAEKEYYGEFAPQRHLFEQYGI
jgi:hypothetical protein